jgi:F0F1-type ATP synthase epsilon subunit
MKRLLIMIPLVVGCAGTNVISREFRPEDTIHYSQLDKLAGIQDLKKHAVYLEEGDRFLLKLAVDTGIIGIADSEVDVEARQKLFFMLRIADDISEEQRFELEKLTPEKLAAMRESDKRKLLSSLMLYVSRDARQWAPVNDIRAVKQVFGSKGGTVSFGMGMSMEQGIWSYLGVREVK